MYAVPGACRQALTTTGQREVGARAANLHIPDRPMIIAKLEQRLDHSGMATCEHMQQIGWCRQLSEVSLVRSCEQAALGAVRLEHANEQLQVCHEAVGHLLRLEPHPAPKAGRRPHCRNLEDFCRHRGKTLDRGASSGGARVKQHTTILPPPGHVHTHVP